MGGAPQPRQHQHFSPLRSPISGVSKQDSISINTNTKITTSQLDVDIVGPNSADMGLNPTRSSILSVYLVEITGLCSMNLPSVHPAEISFIRRNTTMRSSQSFIRWTSRPIRTSSGLFFLIFLARVLAHPSVNVCCTAATEPPESSHIFTCVFLTSQTSLFPDSYQKYSFTRQGQNVKRCSKPALIAVSECVVPETPGDETIDSLSLIATTPGHSTRRKEIQRKTMPEQSMAQRRSSPTPLRSSRHRSCVC